MRHEIPLPETATPGQYGVYVALDGDGEALYIGRTQNLPERLKGHRSQSDWYLRMRSVEWTPCADLVEARSVEKSMIATFWPAANINDHVPVRAGRLALPDWTAEKLRSLYPGLSLELNGYIRALRAAGWPLASIAAPLHMTREAVRLRETQDYVRVAFGVPRVPVKAKPVKPAKPDVTPEQRKRLLKMHAVARTVNGATPTGDPRRAVSVELTEYIAEIHLSGVTLGRIARAMGVSYLGVKTRLARHGYTTAPPSMSDVVYLGHPAEHTTTPKTHCIRGHQFTPENTRLVNGDPGRRVCRSCERLRCESYRTRKQVAS